MNSDNPQSADSKNDWVNSSQNHVRAMRKLSLYQRLAAVEELNDLARYFEELHARRRRRAMSAEQLHVTTVREVPPTDR
jgi:hypothetical protein